MVQAIILFVIGLILMCVAGDKFVDAAVGISKKLGIPQIIIGATIVSVGTTLPEVLVSTTAALSGSSAIAAGNAFGSIICNTALIAAFTQLCRPSKDVDTSSFGWAMAMFLAIAAALTVIGAVFGSYNRITGVCLLLCAVAYAILNIHFAGKNTEISEETNVEDQPVTKNIVILVICAALLFIGARLLVNNGMFIAEAIGVPERVIAVTFIALGTSLPELVTAISSLLKGFSDVSLGNIIGANLLNLVLVIGIPSAITGMTLDTQVARVDAPLGILVMLILLVPFFVKKRGYRLQGAVLLAIYAVYCISQF